MKHSIQNLKDSEINKSWNIFVNITKHFMNSFQYNRV